MSASAIGIYRQQAETGRFSDHWPVWAYTLSVYHLPMIKEHRLGDIVANSVTMRRGAQ